MSFAIYVRACMTLCTRCQQSNVFTGDRLVALAYPGAHSRLSNHIDLFSPAIRGLGSEQQVQQWGPVLSNFGVIGCFCMTELGHGSYARGIETTATFDQQTDSFIIHSPNVTSAKVWIGSAGKTATHAVVYAQLIVEGSSHGLNAFIVQLRHTHTGKTKPGITCGDMGAKMGRNALDNGIVWFSGVSVPRSSLLSKYTQVTCDGSVSVSPMQQLSFLALVGGRIMMVHAAYGYLSMAATIATRYLACRRQFLPRSRQQSAPATELQVAQSKTTSQAHAPPATGAGEVVVLDYPVQSRKLASAISTALAFHAAGWQLEELHADTKDALSAASSQQNGMKSALSSLKTLHNVSAALKAESTWSAYSAIDVCRQACGGVGYSAYSGLPGLQADFAVLPTWEGDNTLMCMQTGGFILKALKAASAGKPTPEVLSWLPVALQTDQPIDAALDAANASDVSGVKAVADACIGALRWVVAQRAMSIGGALASGKSTPDQSAEALVAMTRSFAAAYVGASFLQFAAQPAERGATQFWRKFRSVRGSLRRDQSCKAEAAPGVAISLLLHRYAALYVLNSVFDHASGFVGSCSSSTWARLHELRDEVADSLRPDLVATCDSFGHSDFVLGSAVGNFNGTVYESYLSAIKSAPGFAEPQACPSWQDSFGALLSSPQLVALRAQAKL